LETVSAGVQSGQVGSARGAVDEKEEAVKAKERKNQE